MTIPTQVQVAADAVHAHLDGAGGRPCVYLRTPEVTVVFAHDSSHLPSLEAAAADQRAVDQLEHLIAVLLDFVYAIRGGET